MQGTLGLTAFFAFLAMYCLLNRDTTGQLPIAIFAGLAVLAAATPNTLLQAPEGLGTAQQGQVLVVSWLGLVWNTGLLLVAALAYLSARALMLPPVVDDPSKRRKQRKRKPHRLNWKYAVGFFLFGLLFGLLPVTGALIDSVWVPYVEPAITVPGGASDNLGQITEALTGVSGAMVLAGLVLLVVLAIVMLNGGGKGFVRGKLRKPSMPSMGGVGDMAAGAMDALRGGPQAGPAVQPGQQQPRRPGRGGS